ncbi:MAG: glycosyltransferase family 2 protein [bacterium]|nr:glycosyltransferase family 2 protein [bacterium]
MSGRAPITVIIPNYNGERWLRGCLDALSRQTAGGFSVLVVDNGSTDGSLRILRERAAAVSVLPLPRNEGFAAAVNAGIRATAGEFVALLNNDTEVRPDWLAELVAVLERRPDVAFCASRMLDFRDRSVIDSAGDCFALNGRSVPRGFLAPDGPPYDREEEVFGACAGAALYRRRLFDEIGLFDERFVSYKEDVDLDFRAQLRDRRCLYAPRAVCHHIGGATSGRRRSDAAVRLSARNGVTTFVKNMPAAFLPRALPALLFDLLLQAGYQILKGRQAAPLIRGLAGALGHLPHALAERRRIQAGARPDLRRLAALFEAGAAEVALHRRRCRAAGIR